MLEFLTPEYSGWCGGRSPVTCLDAAKASQGLEQAHALRSVLAEAPA